MNRFCTACGKSLDKDTSFCGACGKPVKASGQTATTSGMASTAANASSVGNAGGSSRAPKQVVDLPPETVFAGTAGGGIPPEPDPAYFDVGDESDNDNRKMWIGGGAIALLLLAGLYYFLFIADDFTSDDGGRPTATAEEPEDKAVEISLFYATSGANIRDKALVDGSEILGKLKRGDEARGTVIQGEDDGGEWLKLEDDQGFVFLANLNEKARPKLAQNFGRKSIRLGSAAVLLSAPSADAETIDNLSKGLKLNIAGITVGDYAEVLLRKGGVGYIADGAKIVKDGDGPRGAELAIKLDVQGCASGDEVDRLFKQLDARNAAELQKIEDADYADEESREAAVEAYYSKIEGKSQFQKLQRSFKGLQVSGIARHYEAQSIYFAEAPETVRKKFRDLGIKVSSDGELASRDISAGIFSARGDGQKYGKTALECGV